MTDNYDRAGRKVDDWGNRQAGKFADRPKATLLKWFLGIVAFFVVIGVFFSILGWVGDWGNEAKRIFSPKNVREQQTAIIGDYEGMKQAAINACEAKGAARGANDPSLLEDPTFAYRAVYRKIAVDYNRRQNNLFEGKRVGPTGLPRDAPSLQEMQRKVC